jgi:precorrin-6Y C5,15-methyltransferase (decarboxylating)
MTDVPWLTIIGIGEDGPDGLALAARQALAQAQLVMGAARHLALLPTLDCPVLEWPVPFADGVPLLLKQRGRRVVLLASGDPFWFGAGSVVTAQLTPGEWTAYPAPSCFTLAAARLGWAIERTACIGLHAAPLARIRPYLIPGRRMIALLRDSAAVQALADYLETMGFGASRLHVLEALGGPRERIRSAPASDLDFTDISHPVAVGIACAGNGVTLPCTSGLPDKLFAHDGQMTKRPVRALTLSALAPRAGELLWDIGAGSGSIGIEWLLTHPDNRAMAFEADPVRAARAAANAGALGVDRLDVVTGHAPAILPDAATPDAVFIGGGLSDILLTHLFARLPVGTRLVANAVTLESEALLARAHGEKGGDLLRIELADAAPLGSRRGWRAHYPLVQWSVTL